MAETELKTRVYAAKYAHSMDDKRRLQIPFKWRFDGQGEEFLLLATPNGWEKNACITVLPAPLSSRLVATLSDMSFNDSKAESLRRFYGERSDTASIDKVGRIGLPEWMTQAVAIDKDVVLVGMMDRFQIWNPDRYKTVSLVSEEIAAEAWKLI